MKLLIPYIVPRIQTIIVSPAASDTTTRL